MFITSALSCLVLLAVLYLTSADDDPRNTNRGALAEYSALLDLFDERYIGEFDISDVTDAAMRAAVASLGDRWSYYMNPLEYAAYQASSDNRYTGIGVGVVIDEETKGMLVSYVYKNSGADTAGILTGDIITAVDGESILGFTFDEMRDQLRRPIGDTVELTVIRKYEGTIYITVVYAVVFIDPVSYEILDDDIGYLELANFDTDAAKMFRSAVEDMVLQGARAIIYDVRGNNGGRVNEVTGILDFLLPEGEIFISVDKSGVEKITMSDEAWIDLPAVVLVDSYSYSGAEYFAAMLGEYGYAEVVGEQTTGKSRMQVTIELSGGGALHISSSQYLTKERVSLHDTGGLAPDYVVSLSESDYALLLSGELEPEADLQLLAALSLLR